MAAEPLIVGLGGSTRDGSQSEFALGVALRAAAEAGAEVVSFTGSQAVLPFYVPGGAPDPAAERFIACLRDCDGVIVSTPSYHGGVSGMIKNALDYTEELRNDARPYLHGRAVGLIVCAAGWQNVGTTLAGMRSIIHALRAWPTPMGAGINTRDPVFDGAGDCTDEASRTQLEILGRQVVDFARLQMTSRYNAEPAQSAAAGREAVNAY